jgi:CMP/dCMP kinase
VPLRLSHTGRLTSHPVDDLLITIDGPAGTGKSTVSRRAAIALEIPHLDTGAFYRAATLAALERDIDLEDEGEVCQVVASIFMDQVDGNMFVDGADVSEAIRLPEVSNSVSVVSAHPRVRSALVDHQRAWVELHGGSAVVEGRDTGSVVFPEANLKVYLDASPEIRARRRSGETGEAVEVVLGDLARRDHLDSSRPASPLSVPKDGITIDTTDLTVSQVVDAIVALVEKSSS